MKLNRFSASLLFAAALAAVLPGTATSQNAWPAKPVTIMIGYTPGSGMDVVGRFLAEGLRKVTGQAFIVENKPGAFGNIAAAAVARSKPDGHTVLFAPGAMAIYPHMFKNTPFNPNTDFSTITTVSKVSYLLIVNPAAVPANTVKELTEHIKAHPGKTAYGSGNATVEIAGTMYQKLAGLDSTNVRYKGVPEALTDLLGGRITYMFADSSFIMPILRQGKVKGLGVAAHQRTPAAPEMPTMVEAGVPSFDDFSGWMTMFAPANTPVELRNRFAELCNSIMATEEGKNLLARQGLEAFPSSPAKTDAFFKDELNKWGRLVSAAGLQAE
jgi:tripartite-type tricarboxylate transporter receptor subunit TctC